MSEDRTPDHATRWKCHGCPAEQVTPNIALPKNWIELRIKIGTGDYTYKDQIKILCSACGANYLQRGVLPAEKRKFLPKKIRK